jgi:hypothetical protein
MKLLVKALVRGGHLMFEGSDDGRFGLAFRGHGMGIWVYPPIYTRLQGSEIL